MEFITDRNQNHVARLKRLRSISWNDMTDSQKAEYIGSATRGAYNYTDLNRVESAVAELAVKLGLSLVTKTNWTLWDIPVASEMERYLGNVVAIRDACPGSMVFPNLPSTMNGLTFESANNIEKVLFLVYQSLDTDTDSSIRCGDIYCGEVE